MGILSFTVFNTAICVYAKNKSWMVCEMKKMLSLMMILFISVSLSAKDKKGTTYAKIYKLIYVDGTTTYGYEEFKDSAAEKKFMEAKKKELDDEYKISMEEYKTAMDEYRKSKEKDKTQPMKVYKPSFRLESRKYTSEKDREKMDKSLEKKNIVAEKANEKLNK